MRFNASSYADFKVITNKLTSPTVIYSAAGTDVFSACAFSGSVYVFAIGSGGGQLSPITPEATLTTDFPSAGKVSSLSVT